MKIYFRNKAARLTRNKNLLTCKRCPFSITDSTCPYGTWTIVDCNCKGWWIEGESSDIFKV